MNTSENQSSSVTLTLVLQYIRVGTALIAAVIISLDPPSVGGMPWLWLGIMSFALGLAAPLLASTTAIADECDRAVVVLAIEALLFVTWLFAVFAGGGLNWAPNYWWLPVEKIVFAFMALTLWAGAAAIVTSAKRIDSIRDGRAPPDALP